MSKIIEIQNVSKEFKVLNRREGLRGRIEFTTTKMMTGVLEPTSGSILVNGSEPYRNRTKNAQEIGVVFGQRSQLWWSLPLIESFKLLKDIYRVGDAEYNGMMDMYRELVDIEKLLHKPVRQMSLGQRTLSDILAAFLHDPKIVFLDEPTIGLDVSMKARIRGLMVADQDEWVSVLVDEEKTTVMDVLNRLIKTLDVRDMRLEEISTEDVIKKIYEEGAA